MAFKLVLCLGLVAHTWALPFMTGDEFHIDPSTGALVLDENASAGRDNLETDSDDIAKYTSFYLYTREYNDDYQLFINDTETLKNSTFDPTRPTKIAIHGYAHSYKTEAVQLIRDAYLAPNSSQNVNVIGVEWSRLCREPPLGFYVQAVANVPLVGQYLGQLINFLVLSGGADVSSFHLIGHSLGAHVSAFAANNVSDTLSTNFPRISGLDPALPLYGNAHLDQRLDRTDADVVDCIHTCGGVYGFYEPLGTIDFYPNGGTPIQPGCWLDIDRGCSHASVVRYFASSVLYPFQANMCLAFDHVKKAECNGTVGYMGDAAINSPEGIYYLATDGSYPYTKTQGTENQ